MLLDGKKVIEQMEINLFTVASLHEQKGIAKNAIINARNGRGISVTTARRLCEAFNCKIDDLMIEA